MSGRGTTQRITTEHKITLERAMVTRRYEMEWDLDRCVGCQIGPLVCPKDAAIHVEGAIVDGHLATKPAVDIDAEKCVLCGICEVMCPKNAITLTINNERENPALVYEIVPEPIQSNTFDKAAFDWSRRDFVMDNCPTNVISYDKERDTLAVDDAHCIRCRQCEVASDGAFHVVQPWQGKVDLHRERCVEGCFACADICPTRALHVNDEGELVLADYYCIKCGACMQVCPIKPEYEEYTVAAETDGVTKTETHKRIANTNELPILVERWRIGHRPVKSAAWTLILTKTADDEAGEAEIDSKRALKRRDLLKALVGYRNFEPAETQEDS